MTDSGCKNEGAAGGVFIDGKLYINVKNKQLNLHPQCCELLVRSLNEARIGLTHTPQSLLLGVEKLPSGGVVIIFEALPPTLADQLVPTHSNSNWESMGFVVHSEGGPMQV